ncbi:senescence-associated carboxylesterase 101-like [Gastrolobium bilobum]|uniref:senescence-associated carboxylesterase 101-like n=1 Tax=Gastrolobium bilobum TaxID=150636 RepID=UPI002AB1E21E|nr:senescence-associated carboxylesterase 101-like [Gastrolobium bilobum]
MDPSMKFKGEMGLAPFVTSSDLLQRSWKVISDLDGGKVSEEGEGVSWYYNKDSDVRIIAFKAKQVSDPQPDLVTSSDLKEKMLFYDFDFLRTESNPIFSVNNTAVSLFIENLNKLNQLKSEIDSSKTLIVTGHALGGSVASLFTISLLNSIDSGKNRPLCITFGSPLIGDNGLQQAISRSSNWNSCFLHVVSHKDPLPRLFITNHDSQTNAYMPFGTFLLCSDENSASFENPGSILRLLRKFDSEHDENQGSQPVKYGEIVNILKQRTLFKDLSTLPEDITNTDTEDETNTLLGRIGACLLPKKNPVQTQHRRSGGTNTYTLLASIILPLSALGLPTAMEPEDMKEYVAKMTKDEEKREEMMSRLVFDPYVNLNVRKIDMVKLEWYKKESKDRNIGYYDSYKKMLLESDKEADMFKKKLTDYWVKMVEVAETKPQKEGSNFRKRWLGAGTNYRRMVEPLVIAKYYKVKGNKDYVTEKRPKHFKMLEKWLKEGTTEDTICPLTIALLKKNVEALLTKDSCFWAHVEEALLSCKELKDAQEDEETMKKLVEFEDYVYGQLKIYEVSPEIFLAESSYMLWWNEYKAIKGASYNSELARFMNDATNLEQYAEGAYDFP